MSAPPDHYSVLGVSSDATADDVAAQARRVRTEFHPDKFSRDAAAQQSAEAAFKRASDAFEVLGDSASRAIYDRFGHDGVQEAKQLGLVGRSSALSTSLRTPAETVEKYALNRRLRKEKELASDLGIGGNMNMRLDAARLFALPREDESLSDRLTSGVEVSSMDMGSNVYIPLGERDTAFVSSYLGVRGNGTGGGNFVGVWTRQWTPNRSSDVTLIVGDALSLGGRTTQIINPTTKGVAGLTLNAGSGLTTLLGGERELLPGLVSKLQVELSDSGPEWATELNYSPEARYRIKNAFKINPVQLSWLSEWAYQLSPLTRITIKGSIALPSMAQLAQIRGRAAYHFFNYPLKMLRCEVLARHVINETTSAATVGVVAQIDKIALQLAYERGPQKLALPVAISNELSAASLAATLAATAVVCALIKYYYIDPRAEARDRRNHAKENLRKSGVSLCAKAALKEALERSHAAHAEAMEQAKSEADDYQRGLADRARSKFIASKQGGGLVIHRAIYGVLPINGSGGGGGGSGFASAALGMAGAKDFEESDGSSLLETPPELEPEPEPEPAPGVVGGGDVERKRLAFYDVTTALQLRIEEKSRRGVGMRLRLETDTDYAEQQGFTDPCMGVKKQLRIAYSWRGQQFLATMNDRQTFTLPNEAHRLGQ